MRFFGQVKSSVFSSVWTLGFVRLQMQKNSDYKKNKNKKNTVWVVTVPYGYLVANNPISESKQDCFDAMGRWNRNEWEDVTDSCQFFSTVFPTIVLEFIPFYCSLNFLCFCLDFVPRKVFFQASVIFFPLVPLFLFNAWCLPFCLSSSVLLSSLSQLSLNLVQSPIRAESCPSDSTAIKILFTIILIWVVSIKSL